ncbi:MAG: transglycosylase domain-containing protein [candidate division KSB1 bacterium]|nr:transglycosylase domain-containing protein [candidate division KSB1 bacterium]MDZ7301054.1 transglycosylase domain-containing protein [candidate division KSB1 bacterium]MDZ7312122.1 transglycosylase domain-containing protein [candidate division KSB1 bacterium]
MRPHLIFILITLLTAGMLFIIIGFFVVVKDLPHIPDDLRNLVYSQPTEIYAADGSLVQRLGGKSYVPLSRISPNFQKALLAAEDGEFYSHHGIDKIAIVRSAIFRGFKGSSTLTQQLVKNLFFSFRREWLRKIKEILISFQLESTFTKEQILEAYCNLVWFGGSAYGVEDAARQFFGKSAATLTLTEAAMLAAIINSPTKLNPFSHYEAAQFRQRVILRRMLKKNFIDAPTYTQALADSVRLTGRPGVGNDFIDYVIAEAEDRFGREAVHYGGLKIYTTMDPQLQVIAEETIAKGVADLEANLDSTGVPLQGALAAVSVPTGEVRALVGGRYYVPSGFNRAVSNNRHIGSGVKPFVYFAALENLKMTPISIVNDTVTTFILPNRERWSPRNFDRRHRGRLILKSALMQSVNVISAQLTAALTPQRVVETCQRFGVSSLDTRKDAVLSISLGSVGISPLEMAAAYAVFANNGVYYKPIALKRVEDVNGVILERTFVFGDPRLDAQLSYEMLDMMRGVVDGGTAQVIRAMGFQAPAAGKTGTSTEFTDAWFTGFTSALSTSVWVGYDRDHQMYTRRPRRGVDGARGGAPIWTEFMKRALLFYPANEFEIPPGIKIWYVNPRTGARVPDPQFGIPVALPENIEPGFAPFWEGPEAIPKSDTTEAG